MAKGSNNTINENKNLGMKDELQRIDREITEEHRLFATGLITFPGYISSSRTVMLNSHSKQYKNMLKAHAASVGTM